MPDTAAPTTTRRADWHAREPDDVVAALATDAAHGLDGAEAARRLAADGPNSLPRAPKPTRWTVALGQARDPMNLMLVAVAAVSVVIGEGTTAMVVGALICLNVGLGTSQELKARASIDALDGLQVRTARVRRDGTTTELPASDVVVGDVILVEAGDLVPADSRIVASATLEVQEAALTGESLPVAKSDEAVDDDAALGDRAGMLFQNTSVTRGTASAVVVATGSATEVGRIATMLTSVERTRSPLQRQLDQLTARIGWVAWGTLAVILVVGLGRGLELSDLLLLGTSMAISAIPTGMPTFVQTMLAMGARQLADAKAIVRNLTDVETLGATSEINTDKTGTLTLNEMTVRAVFHGGDWYRVDGEGYGLTGAVRGVAGRPAPDLGSIAYVAALANDAAVTPAGDAVGDPTEAALVVLTEKLGVDVDETRAAYPRLATVPFDSTYKLMATFHRLPFEGRDRVVGLVKGAPDVVLDRCRAAQWSDGTREVEQVREEVLAANARLAERGLRVLALAVRLIDDDDVDAVVADPLAAMTELVLVGLVGIIDPLRPEAIEAVRIAHEAGIDVRMITGDHLVTAEAIGAELGLGPGGMTGAELAALDDDELDRQLPDVHVFGRVTPQDKLRLVQRLQAQGRVVAMTGDAVNDAAALKQADIGVAMGSGSEVSKQAARMILTDDNFATLVQAVALGRSLYERILAYIGYQLTQLFGMVIMFLLATALNVNSGVALLPLQVLFVNFTMAVVPVVVISLEPADPSVMRRRPRDPGERIFNRTTAIRWIALGAVLGVAALAPVALGPGEPALDGPSTPVTMGYVVMALAVGSSAIVLRDTTAPAWQQPLLRPVLWALGAGLLTLVTTEAAVFQRWLDTVPLTGGQWLACLALAGTFAVAVELEKAVRRRRDAAPA
ncbi:MAG TPA: cation-transporting P-type ATPase [Acidimicrobiales bacterium]|nr:cation-transporting P-type ATPase [Acidimicrobiales bacterium]